jgi:ribulose-bisphosphate carboxylase large chain
MRSMSGAARTLPVSARFVQEAFMNCPSSFLSCRNVSDLADFGAMNGRANGMNTELSGQAPTVLDDRVVATYELESPLPLREAVEHLCSEASTGTFIGLPRETPELQARHRARPISVEELAPRAAPSLPSRRFDGHPTGPVNVGRVRIEIPLENLGASVAAVLAAAAGNIFELSSITGLRLVDLELPRAFAERYAGPQFGVAGTRRLMGAEDGVMVGTIIKPSVGLPLDELAEVVRHLIDGGADFIKDDELVADPPTAPLQDRVRVVMEEIERGAERTGRRVMYAFNITDELDRMLDHHDLVVGAGGNCVMVTMNAVGLAAVAHLARHATVPIHGHRATVAAGMRHPALGVDYAVYQKLARLVGVDHLHVSGLNSKFYETDDQVMASIDAVRTPMFGGYETLPVISSGQWAGTMPETARRTNTDDLLILAGAGIHAHPGGLGDGMASIRDAWAAAKAGVSLEEYAESHEALRVALEVFGARA